MKYVFIVLALIAVIAVIAAAAKLPKNGRPKKGSFGPKPINTAHEQKMFWRLVEAFPMPEYIVLTQVSFGAMLKAKDGASRYSFSQKMADFVVCNKGFKVLAAIELDDASHKGKEDKDASRDAMLIEAGYKVLRYAKLPEVAQLQSDLLATPEAVEVTKPMTLADRL